MPVEPLAATLPVIEVLEDLGVRYLIGGSLASAIHGVVRATLDADIVAELELAHVDAFVAPLAAAFYIDADMIRDAIRARSSFNVIHLATMFKVDVFIPKNRRFDREQLERREPQVVELDPPRTLYFASAEDTVLAKLEWYHPSGEVSERQWRDVLGVLAVQGNRLDLDYMRRIAATLGVAELLERALAERS